MNLMPSDLFLIVCCWHIQYIFFMFVIQFDRFLLYGRVKKWTWLIISFSLLVKTECIRFAMYEKPAIDTWITQLKGSGFNIHLVNVKSKYVTYSKKKWIFCRFFFVCKPISIWLQSVGFLSFVVPYEIDVSSCSQLGL